MTTHLLLLREAFLARQRQLGRSPEVIDLIDSEWAVLAIHFAKAGAPAMRNFLGAFARFALRGLPSGPGLEHLGKLLASDLGRPVWQRFLHQLAADPKSLPSLHATLHDLVRARAEARAGHPKVEFATIRVSITHVIRSLFRLEGHIALAADPKLNRSDALTASTDGRLILLPESIDFAPTAVDNLLAYVRLAAHEAAHILAGSFVPFPEVGAPAYARIPTLAPLLRPREAAFHRATRLAKRRDWTWLPESRRPAPNEMNLHLFAAFHMKDPPLFLWLANLVEDARIERWLRTHHPNLSPLVDYLDALERARSPHPATLSAFENARAVLAARVLGHPIIHVIPNIYRELFRRFDAEIAPLLEAPIPSMEHSLVIALHLHDLCVAQLPQPRPKESRIPLRALDRSFVIAHGARGATRESEDDAAQADEPAMKAEKGDVSEGRKCQRYPEFNSITNRFDLDAAHVYEDDPIMASPPPRPHATQAGFETLLPAFEGDALDPDRAYDLIVSRRGHGRPTDERIFLNRRGGRALPNTGRLVTFVVDLSNSMARNGTAPNQLPLTQLRNILQILIPTLESRGVHTQVLGGYDYGRRLVHLKTLKPVVAPPSPWDANLASLRAPGFRHAAFVRHLSKVLPERGPDVSHHLVLCTDTASHYLVHGFESPIRHASLNCATHCTLKAQRCFPDPINPSRLGKEGILFLETLYEMADLRLAIEDSPLPVQGLLFGTHYRDKTLDGAFGPARWTRVTSPDDAAPAARHLAEPLLDRAWSRRCASQ